MQHRHRQSSVRVRHGQEHPSEASATDAYGRAGLASAEVECVAALVAAVEAGDPLAPWVAVRRVDVVRVVGALDKFVDRFTTCEGMAASRSPWPTCLLRGPRRQLKERARHDR
jgi:hypothetical protein